MIYGFGLVFVFGFLFGKYLCDAIKKIFNKIDEDENDQTQNFNVLCLDRIFFIRFLLRLLSGVLSFICFYKFGLGINFFVALVFLYLLVIIFFVDLYFMIILDEIIFFLWVLAIIFWLRNILEISFLARLFGCLIISLLMLIINFFIKNSFGLGDIKLFCVSGFILGWKNNLLAFLIAIISASIFSCVLIFIGRKKFKSYIAFGPFICLGIIIAFFFGREIINFYRDRILF